VVVGSLVSSSAPDRYIRPVITFVIAASGLKYVGVGTTALGWILCATLLAAAAAWLAYIRPQQQRAKEVELARRAADPLTGEPAESNGGPNGGPQPGGESLTRPYSA
jgi:hypothetical protein